MGHSAIGNLAPRVQDDPILFELDTTSAVAFTAMINNGELGIASFVATINTASKLETLFGHTGRYIVQLTKNRVMIDILTSNNHSKFNMDLDLMLLKKG
jgi:hypothetical protein